MRAAKALLPRDIVYCDDPYTAVKEADALLIMTEWNEYRNLDLSRIQHEMQGNVIVDLRNIYNPTEMATMGFNYTGVGRGTQ